MKLLFSSLFCLFVLISQAQNISVTVANAHSHNDYEQSRPFYMAYNEQFGSMEADIYLVKGKLLVAHEPKQLDTNKTLESLYLDPLTAYHNTDRKLQLLIDIKTQGVATLDTLIRVLKKYPFIIQNKNFKITISGNRPADSLYANYPNFIWFDGTLGKDYNAKQLSKISLLSESFYTFIKSKFTFPLLENEKQKLEAAIEKGHAYGKPVRLWASPDYPEAWEALINMKVDFINTDKINALSDYLVARNKQVRLLPYNRIIKSAGEVIRFGKPMLENHALDIAIFKDKNKVVVEERNGIFIVDLIQKKIVDQWLFDQQANYRNYASTYSGIKTFTDKGNSFIVWSAANTSGDNASIMIAQWDNGIKEVIQIPFSKKVPARNALPNEIQVRKENNKMVMYVTLNGNNELVKVDWTTKQIIWTAATGVAPYGVAVSDQKVFVSNWAGQTVTDTTKESAGVPWGLSYTNPATGATAGGSVSVFNAQTGKFLKELKTGLHPNVMKASPDGQYIYVANGSSDEITVIQVKTNTIVENIFVGLLGKSLQGSSPNGLTLSEDGKKLFVSNGLDNAIAVIQLGKKSATNGLGKSVVLGFIPTQAYPAGLQIVGDRLVVANLESDGAKVVDQVKKARSIHQELASISIIPIPNSNTLKIYTQEVAQLNLLNRTEALALQPRPNIPAKPVPERIGEPSVFKHVVYIIKENKTYDQVFGDMKGSRADSTLCVFGNKITPNTHALAKQFGYMDDYNASGKSSAEGHQWTDAGMVSDYVEKNVRAWFRSYPHRQEDALVYNKAGFIWNHALDHGKTVRVYGEACETEYDQKLNWFDLYKNYTEGQKPNWKNKTTIARLNPIISPTFPDCDNINFSDQQRTDIFIEDWKKL
jgi:YVTN family beta-propeller protein